MTRQIEDYLDNLVDDKRVVSELHKTLVNGALNSSEVSDESELDNWFEKRFLPNSTVLVENDYATALIRALWLAPKLASIDFVGGRLRDFAQLWSDTARGFLGEIAVQKFLFEKFGFKMRIDTRRGQVEEFMPSDISVFNEDGSYRAAKINVSIKTGKFNSRWLEVPESQFNQSDVFVFVKLGISRYHFSSYLKEMGTIKRMFEIGKELKELDDSQIERLSGEIPNWTRIPAYISGFVNKQMIKLPIHSLEHKEKRRRLAGVSRSDSPISEISIESGIGIFSNDSIENWPSIAGLSNLSDVPFIIAGIGKEVDGKFYASTGSLEHEQPAWQQLVNCL